MRISTVIYVMIAAAGAAGVGMATFQLIQEKAAKPVIGSTVEQPKPAATQPVASKAAAPASETKASGITILAIKSQQKPMRPAFTLPDLEDKPRSISEFDGKVIILNFWASWCPPCVKEMPSFVRMQEKYGKQGLQVIGVAVDQKQLAMDFADRMSVNYPIMYGGLNAADIGKNYGNLRGQLPYTVIINREKQLVAVKQGEITEAEMETMIKPWLNTGAASNKTASTPSKTPAPAH